MTTLATQLLGLQEQLAAASVHDTNYNQALVDSLTAQIAALQATMAAVGNLASLQGQLASLRTAYRSGVSRSSYEGKSVDYRSGDEMRAAIASLENQIAAISGTTIPRTVVVRSSKGW
jgi:hypothetical protein